MTPRKFQVHVPGTVARVMQAILDVPQWPQWRPGILHVLHISDLPLAPGSLWVDTRQFGEHTVRISARIVEMDPPRIFAYALSGGGLDASVRWTAKQEGDQVLVEQEVEVHSAGLRALVTNAKSRFLASQRETMVALRQALRSAAASQPEAAT